MDENLFVSTEQMGRLMISSPITPKVIAKITLCGVFEIDVCDNTGWNPPTQEQIKNLKEMLNIDVELIGEDDDL